MAKKPEGPGGDEPWRKHLQKSPKPEIPEPGDKPAAKKAIDRILGDGPRRPVTQPPVTGHEAQTPQRKPRPVKAKGGSGPKAKTPQGEAAQGAASAPAGPNFISSEELERMRQEAQSLLWKRALEEKRRKELGLDRSGNSLPKRPDGDLGR